MELSKSKKALILFVLMLAGESVFLLPFVLVRVFRPAFLDVFHLSNLELGSAFSIYGLLALLSYFFGGPLADRFSARKLMALSLVVTGLAGLALAFDPSLFTLCVLYGFWGISSIFLFWAAFIKAIRYYGGEEQQGRSYGWVDAGRGLVAAVLAWAALLLFEFLLPNGSETQNLADRSSALEQVIFLFCLFTACCGVLVFRVLPKDEQYNGTKVNQIDWSAIAILIKQRKIWFHALIVLSAYIGYKCTDDFSLYGTEVLGMEEVEAGQLAVLSFFLRPLGAVIAGYLGDRYKISNMLFICFMMVLVGSLSLANGSFLELGLTILVVNIAVGSLGIYGLRGIYFALFKEYRLPLKTTGSAVGLISVIGYSPDVFFGPLMGFILDSSPGAAGHQNLFWLLSAFSILGIISLMVFKQATKN